jgi:ADP-heptose:LPS heptosyltransferase
MRALVLRPGALGDALLSVPALRALRAHVPGLHLTLAANPAAAHFLEQVGEVDRGMPFDSLELAWLWGRDAALALDANPRLDLAVAWLADPDCQVLRALQAAVTGPVLVAPSRPPEGGDGHTAQFLPDALRPLGISPVLDAAPFSLDPIASASVLIHPGSGSSRKNWPPDRFAGVAAQIRDLGGSVALIVGEADAEAAGALERALGETLPRLQAPELYALARRLAGCRAYLGNDSGVSHLAGLSGARTVALFGPTSPATWRPIGPRVTVLPFGSTNQDVVDAVRGVPPLPR